MFSASSVLFTPVPRFISSFLLRSSSIFLNLILILNSLHIYVCICIFCKFLRRANLFHMIIWVVNDRSNASSWFKCHQNVNFFARHFRNGKIKMNKTQVYDIHIYLYIFHFTWYAITSQSHYNLERETIICIWRRKFENEHIFRDTTLLRAKISVSLQFFVVHCEECLCYNYELIKMVTYRNPDDDTFSREREIKMQKRQILQDWCVRSIRDAHSPLFLYTLNK